VSAADAEYKLADAFADALACVCRHVHVVHVFGRVHKRTHVRAATCGRRRVHERVREGVCLHSRARSRSWKRSRLHISAVLPVHTIVS